MDLPFDSKRIRGYEFEFGAGGNRLGCKLRVDDGSLLYILDSQITPEIEQFISSLGPPAAEQLAAKKHPLRRRESCE
jgi:hypothetical protein